MRSEVTSLSNWAKDRSTLSVSRPIEVVVLNCWVTETNDTPCASNSSTSLAKSARTKHEIALDQLRCACATGLPRGVVLMDAGYGNNSELRAEITALERTYVAGILSNTTVWSHGTGPLPPKKWSGRGRPPKRLRLDATHQPISVKELALSLPKRAWHRVEWREGTPERLSSRFARVRIRVARTSPGRKNGC